MPPFPHGRSSGEVEGPRVAARLKRRGTLPPDRRGDVTDSHGTLSRLLESSLEKIHTTRGSTTINFT